MRQQPIQFNIDLGELEEALQGIASVAEGFAGKSSVDKISKDATSVLDKRFEEHADQKAALTGSNIAHVYEWSSFGVVDASKAGRLWESKIVGSGSKQTIQFWFKKSTRQVPLPPEAEEDAERRGFDRATHIWADKAHDQEYTRVFNLHAGGPAPTRTSPGKSQWLLIYDNQGRPMYKKSWKNYSPYVGQFRAFFETYWQTEPEKYIEKEGQQFLKTEFKRAMEKEIQKNVKSGRVSRPPVAQAGIVNLTVKGVARKMKTTAERKTINRTTRVMRGLFKR